jgi:hypothetical protein
MIKTELRLPELMLIAGTRALLGAGIGLLAADRLNERQRTTVGRTLVAIGALSTVPLVMWVFGRRQPAD